MLKRIFLLFILFLFFQAVFSQIEKIDTDRPDQTESAFTIPKNWFQFEMGFNSQRNNSNDKEFFAPTLLSKYGISKKVELRVITTQRITSSKFSSNNTDKENGWDPVEIGAKISFCEEKGLLPKTSLIFHFALPRMASKNFRADKLAPNFRFTMQNSLSKNAALGYNLGAEWDGFSNTPTWIYTFAPGFNLSEKFYGYLEAFGFISKTEKPQHSLDAGIAYYVNNNFKIDFSGGPGISKEAPDAYIAFGFSIRFGKRSKSLK